jgi:hypothetical protein
LGTRGGGDTESSVIFGDIPVPPPVMRTTRPLTEKRASGLRAVGSFDWSDMVKV